MIPNVSCLKPNGGENFRRPELLIKPLDKATERISKKDQNIAADLWANWFGIARWIIACSKSEKELKSDETRVPSNWYWPLDDRYKFSDSCGPIGKSDGK